MLHFSNQELATNYHVSVRTVRNWIESAKAGKLELTLHTKGERTYIANTSKNTVIIEGLVARGKKYRPHRSQKIVSPQSKFYELYTQEQLYEIVSNLEINHEIPRQYNYFGEGAVYWDEYVNHQAEEEAQNGLLATIGLLEKNRGYIDYLLAHSKQINVIDVGVGNAMPVRDFLHSLIEQDKLGRYIAIDISPTILKIAESNIKKWFGDKVVFEGHLLDIDHDRFGYLLAKEYIKSTSESTNNVLFFVGGTIANFKQPETVLKVIHDSMGVNDFLIHEQRLDTQSSRRNFNFNSNSNGASLAPIHRYIFDLLNIDASFYEMDMGFDLVRDERYIRAELKVALSIRFMFKGGERTIAFNKGDAILLWRARQSNILEVVKQLTDNDFSPLQISQTNDQEFILTISRIQHD